MELQRGTYVRESGGGCLLYHSPVQWNDASYALHRYLCGESRSSLSEWRRVTGPEADAVWDYCRLDAGESVEFWSADEWNGTGPRSLTDKENSR